MSCEQQKSTFPDLPMTEPLTINETRYQEEAEYEAEVVDLFMTYDCEDPADLKIIKRKLKEL